MTDPGSGSSPHFTADSGCARTQRDPIRDHLRLYAKRESEFIEHILITCFSSFTSRPLNLGVMAPTSEGKTYVIDLVTSLFPNVAKFLGASSKSFFFDDGPEINLETREEIQPRLDQLNQRLEELKGERTHEGRIEKRNIRAEIGKLRRNSATRVNLQGKILVFLDSPDPGLWNSLKPLLSHDSYESIYQTVNRGVNGIRTKKVLLTGWPACIFASARNEDRWEMWPEIQSRFVIVSPSMDPVKYKQANELTAQLLGLPSFVLRARFPDEMRKAAENEVRRIRQEMERVALLGQVEGKGSRHDNFVFNPFYKWAAELFPAETGVRMRQFRYLMNYANILTMMNADRRASIVIRGQPRALIAHYDDMKAAAGLILTEIAAPVPRFKVDFYRNYILPCHEGNISVNTQSSMKTGEELKFEAEQPITVREIQEYCKAKGKNVGRSWLIKTILEPLADAGYLEVKTDPADRRRNLYQPLHGAQNSGIFVESQYPDPKQVRESLESFQIEFQNIDHEMTFALPDGTFVDDLQKLADTIVRS